MIKSILLKFGRAQGIPATPISTTPITVFVGPNNSGKSKVLQELAVFCSNGQKNQNNAILDSLEFESLSPVKAEERIESVKLTPEPGEMVSPNHLIVGKKGSRQQVAQQDLINFLEKPNENKLGFCRWYLSYNILKLDGQSRINLVNQQGAGDLQKPPHTSFQVLFRDDKKRTEVRRIVFEAFGQYFTIDPTQLGQFRLKLSTQPPQSNLEERGIHDEAVKFHGNALPIDFASDGVKAFTGMITEIIAGDPQVLYLN